MNPFYIRRQRTWLAALFSLGLVLALLLYPLTGSTGAIAQASSPSFAGAASELRGVWLTNIDSDVMFSRRNVDRALQRLARLNFNTVYPSVWNWGYTLYPSAIAEPRSGRRVYPNWGLRQRDMLAETISRGHELGLAVVPWFEFGFMAPADSELAQRHPDWLTSRRDGNPVIMEGIYPRVWLNPFHPEVQQFILSLLTEIVTNYDVDGIQLDDHFGLPSELGYDPYTVSLYQQEHQGQRPPADVHDPEWTRWRADRITHFMREVFHAVKARKPHCLVSLSPNSKDYSYRAFLQDWGTWERWGLVEELIVQVYRNNLNSFIHEIEKPEIQQARTHIPVAVGILSGLKDYPIETALIQQQVEAVRQRELAGVSFFFYETLNNRDQALSALFAEPRRRPSVIQR